LKGEDLTKEIDQFLSKILDFPWKKGFLESLSKAQVLGRTDLNILIRCLTLYDAL